MINDRIEYLDITKGICMLLVIWTHIVSQFQIDNTVILIIKEIVTSFYMPLFFIISGMFAKSNLPFTLFLKKKINTILFPFIIFYIISFIFSFFVSEVLNIELNNKFSFFNLFAIFETKSFSNGALWFLSAIFFSSIIYYVISRVIQKSQIIGILALVLLSSLGFYWNKLFDFRLPFYIDTALTALLFFYCGEKIIKYLYTRNNYKYAKHLMLGLSLIMTFALKGFGGAMVSNGYSMNIIFFYLVGISGTFLVISFSSLLKKARIVEKIGKYSIIALCTHYFLITPLKLIFRTVTDNNILLSFLIFIAIYFLMIPIIYLFKRYLPFFVGLSPIIRSSTE